MIKAVAIDLDGTLLNSEHKISEFNKKIIDKLVNKGIMVMIATGRTYQSLYKYKEELNLKSPVICYNGAMAVDGGNDEKIFELALEEKITKRLVEIAREQDIHLNIFQDEKWYIEAKRDEVDLYAKTSGLKYHLLNFNNFESLAVTKAMFIGDASVLKIVDEKLEKEFGQDLYKAFSRPYFLEVLNKDVSKGKTLVEVLKKKGIKKEEVIAFGDRYNDYEMLKAVGIGVVMENAPSDMKKEFEYKTLSNDDDGVGKFLEEYFNL